MAESDIAQHIVNKDKAEASIYGFGHKAHATQIYGRENLAAITSIEKPLTPAQEEEKKEEKERLEILHILAHQHDVPIEVVNLLKELEGLRAEELRLLEERTAIEVALTRLKEENRQLELDANLLTQRIQALRIKCDDKRCIIDKTMARIARNAEVIQESLKIFESEDGCGDAYQAYLDYRKLAKQTITITAKLEGDPDNRAHPIVFKDECGEYYVLNSRNESIYVKDLPDHEKYLTQIERQTGKGQFFEPNDPIVQEWQEKYAAYYGTESLVGRTIIILHDTQRAYRDAVHEHSKELDELLEEQETLKEQLFQNLETRRLNSEQIEQLEVRLGQVNTRLNEISESIKAKIAGTIEDPGVRQGLFDFLQDNPGMSTEDLIKNMPDELKAYLKADISMPKPLNASAVQNVELSNWESLTTTISDGIEDLYDNVSDTFSGFTMFGLFSDDDEEPEGTRNIGDLSLIREENGFSLNNSFNFENSSERLEAINGQNGEYTHNWTPTVYAPGGQN